MDYRLEVVQVPVSDVDRSKAFYTEQMGFNDDHDTAVADFAGRGLDVGEVQVLGAPGRQGFKHIFFSDPDGNRWTVQEIQP
jgi:catechol 2,3-dioxygenase-like lactoylglutathione lyase family enzyme